MKMDAKKVIGAGLIAASTMFGGLQNVRAEVDYDGIKYLGGGGVVDLNNGKFECQVAINPHWWCFVLFHLKWCIR